MPPTDRDDKISAPDEAGETASNGEVSHSVFVATGSRNLSDEEKIKIAERIVRRFGFESLAAFNKYDKETQERKRKRGPSPDVGAE